MSHRCVFSSTDAMLKDHFSFGRSPFTHCLAGASRECSSCSLSSSNGVLFPSSSGGNGIAWKRIHGGHPRMLSPSNFFASKRWRSSSHGSRKLSFHMRALGFSPLPEKIATGGEDAYISTESVQSVLDGVSWWRDHLSVDAGLYSAALAKHMYEYVEDDLLGDLPASSLRLLQRGYELSKHSNVVGTATALVATLQRNHESKERIYKKDGYERVNLKDWQLAKQEEWSSTSFLYEDENDGAEGEQKQEDRDPHSHAAGLDAGKLAEGIPHGTPTGFTKANGIENEEDIAKQTSLHRSEKGVEWSDPPLPPQKSQQGEEEEEDTLLDVAYVGDCGLIVIRRGRIIYETDAQQHDVDYPFQLGDGSADTPKDGVRVLIPVRRGDVVIMGSDGIFDNVYSRDICKLMWKALETCPFYESAGTTAPTTPGEGESQLRGGQLLDQTLSALNKGIESVLAKAISIANNIRADSPYASRCIENGANFEGGKPDDMTILASILEYEENVADMEKLSEADELFPSPYRDWP